MNSICYCSPSTLQSKIKNSRLNVIKISQLGKNIHIADLACEEESITVGKNANTSHKTNVQTKYIMQQYIVEKTLTKIRHILGQF